MEQGNGKENIDPTLNWRGLDEPKNISTDSLEQSQNNLPQVIDDTTSETSNSFLLDRSIGPALVGTASSIESPAIGGGPLREDGDAKGSVTPTGVNSDRQGLTNDNRETEEYADGLARELINSTSDMEAILSLSNKHQASAAIEEYEEEEGDDEEKEEEKVDDRDDKQKVAVVVEAGEEKQEEETQPEKDKEEGKVDNIEDEKESVEEEGEILPEKEDEKFVKEKQVDEQANKVEEENRLVQEKVELENKLEAEEEVKLENNLKEVEEKLFEEEKFEVEDEEVNDHIEEEEAKGEEVFVEKEEIKVEEEDKVKQEEELPEIHHVEDTKVELDNYDLSTVKNTVEDEEEEVHENYTTVYSESQLETEPNPLVEPPNLVDIQQDTPLAEPPTQTEPEDNCVLVDCDKSVEEMEFTKNYSDDLLMGQSESASGAQKGETMMPSADLADFELPPYSGSSSGSSEPPRQHSPVKRQSSSNSSAAQPSSSHQTNVESLSSPNLSAVKNLLMSSYCRISHVLHWKRPIETGIIFAIGMTLIITLTFFSIISVFAYSALGLILASALIRSYKAVTKALNRSSDLPFDHLWNKIQGLNVSMSPEKTHELVDSSLGNLNASLLYFKQVLLFEDKIATLKSGLFLYMLTYIGAWFNGMTLITISYLALFSVPIFYEKNKTKIDEYLNLAFGQLSSTISLITNKATSLAFGGSSSSSTSTSSSTSSKKQN